MKLIGLHGNQLLRAKVSVFDNSFSTRFKDRAWQDGSFKERIKRLRQHINTEITIVSPYILTLENLATRYYEDGQEAFREGELAYFNQYLKGYEQAKVIIDHTYRCFPKVI